MRSYYLLRELAKYHQVDLMAFIQKALLTAYYDNPEIGLRDARNHLGQFLNEQHYYRIPSEISRFGRYRLIVGSLLSPDPYTINWMKSLVFQRDIIEQLNRKSYDIIHFDTISFASYLSEEIKIPCVLDHHNVESHMMLRRSEKEQNILKKIYFYQEGIRLRSYEKKVLKNFHHHILCSDIDKKRLLDLDDRLQATVIPNGVELPDSPPIRKPSVKPSLLFVGGLNWYPNRDAIHFFLKEVWPIIKVRIPNIEINIVGKSPSDYMINLASRDASIKLHGFVDDIRPFYQSATAYVCPIRDGGGTKLKVIDALANKVPLVSTTIACEGIEVEDGIHVLFADSPEVFAWQVEKILLDPKKPLSLTENGYELVRSRYDFIEIGKKLANLYNSILLK